MVVNRELYFPSLKKEVTCEELISYYQTLLLFNLAKANGNFSMYNFTRKLEVPMEIKIMAKYLYGTVAIDKVLLINTKREIKNDSFINKIKQKLNIETDTYEYLEESEDYAEIYYRIYRYKKYRGMGFEHLRKNITILF